MTEFKSHAPLVGELTGLTLDQLDMFALQAAFQLGARDGEIQRANIERRDGSFVAMRQSADYHAFEAIRKPGGARRLYEHGFMSTVGR